MRIRETVATTLQTALGPVLDGIGRRTGVIQRQRKFTGASLLQTVVLTVMKTPAAPADEFVRTAARLGLRVTPTAVEKRFTAKLVAFLRAGLAQVLQHAIAADPKAIPLLKKFSAVEIGDSTTVRLPDDYAGEFAGCGGKSGSGQAAVKLQLAYELRSGRVTRLREQPGRHSDAAIEDPQRPVSPGALILRDLGYFSLKRFRHIGQQGAFWISRWQPATAVFDETGQPLDLLEYLRQRWTGRRPIDVPIVLGAAERLPCRLIALRVSQEVAARRRQKLAQRACKQGTTPSAAQWAWCEWTVFLTNCPKTLLRWREVVVLYRARWQIELIFKLWKSHNHLAAFRPEWTPVERLAVFWAKLIGVLLQHWLLLTSTWPDPQCSGWKASRVIRDWIVPLSRALKDKTALLGVLSALSEEIASVAQVKKRKQSPSLWQLL
jgi:Transposase DDE domain